jgi:hypothetical protein
MKRVECYFELPPGRKVKKGDRLKVGKNGFLIKCRTKKRTVAVSCENVSTIGEMNSKLFKATVLQ